MALSAAVLWLNTQVVMPACSPDPAHHALAGQMKYGSTLSDIVGGILSHPLEVIGDVFRGGWIGFAAAFLFLPLASPFALLAMAPTIVQHAISTRAVISNMELYYSATLLPFLYIGLLVVLRRKRGPWASKSIPVWLRSAVVLTIFALTTFAGGRYLTFRSWNTRYHELEALKDAVAPNRSLCAQEHLMPHFGYREHIWPLNARCVHKRADEYVYSLQVPHNEEDRRYELWAAELAAAGYERRETGAFVRWRKP
jgi:hypothetical protein